MTKRTYTAADIREFVEAFRASREFSPEKLAGMETIANLCRQLETLSDADLEREVRRLSVRA